MLEVLRNLPLFMRGTLFYDLESRETIASQLELHAIAKPDVVFLRFENEALTYGEANAAINRHANAYRALGVGPGDTVAIVLENRPTFLWHFYGLHRIGAVASLINTNLSGQALAHALRICEPKAAVVGSETWPAVASVLPLRDVPGFLGAFVDVAPGEELPTDTRDFGELLRAASDGSPDRSLRPKLKDLAAYIYTSGTTGLPKAALIRHHRLYRAGAVWASMALRYRAGDVMYCCLPLYHSNAVALASGSVVTAGVTLALARKFSRTRFWDDVRKHRATQIIYIGELCRYLMNSEPSPRDREHEIRSMTGNGLRPDIWRAFQKRFGIERIAEFYAATEGNCVTLNGTGSPGSVGWLAPNMTLARWDEATQSLVRDARGYAIRARVGEPGILVGKISEKAAFDGYRDSKATEQKILRDLFAPGDAYFNTGDLLRRDRVRRLYFTDRIGDTFRWKGENVSTTEVQEALSSLPGVAEVNAYGVSVPNADGRAGMVAVVMNNGAPFDPSAFKAQVDSQLPAYARPLFVRISPQLDTTATFKLKKKDLQEQGFDPSLINEPLYLRHPQRDAYVPLDAELFAALAAGAIRL